MQTIVQLYLEKSAARFDKLLMAGKLKPSTIKRVTDSVRAPYMRGHTPSTPKTLTDFMTNLAKRRGGDRHLTPHNMNDILLERVRTGRLSALASEKPIQSPELSKGLTEAWFARS